MGAVKQHLLKPLLPRKYWPSAPPHIKERRKAIQEVFDPHPHLQNVELPRTIRRRSWICLIRKKNKKLVFRQMPWVIGN